MLKNQFKNFSNLGDGVTTLQTPSMNIVVASNSIQFQLKYLFYSSSKFLQNWCPFTNI